MRRCSKERAAIREGRREEVSRACCMGRKWSKEGCGIYKEDVVEWEECVGQKAWLKGKIFKRNVWVRNS